jgi:hypothetical protein
VKTEVERPEGLGMENCLEELLSYTREKTVAVPR